ncbi:MAG: hypothetical protein GX329_02365 [Tissierellia bacterium]|nr:hypothetical protein [Tissierellia bacterium]
MVENINITTGQGWDRGSYESMGDSLLFFFLLLVILFDNGCWNDRQNDSLLFFFLLLVIIFTGYNGC